MNIEQCKNAREAVMSLFDSSKIGFIGIEDASRLLELIDAEIERQIVCDECEDCSRCVNSGTRLCYEDCGDSYDSERTGKQAYKHYKPKYKYCPNCGRKLGDKNEVIFVD